MSQQVLPLLPAGATAIGRVAGLLEDADGGVVFVSGQATFAFAAGDEVGRRLAAVQLVNTRIASAVAVSAAFGIGTATLWRWKAGFDADGVAGLIPGKRGPSGPSKLTDDVVARVRVMDAEGVSLSGIGAALGLDTATVRVALGRRRGSAGWQARHTGAPAGAPADTGASAAGADTAATADVSAWEATAHRQDTLPVEPTEPDEPDEPVEPVEPGSPLPVLPILPLPVPRSGERAAARTGLLEQAPVVFTEGGHLPLAGLLLILPALESTGLLGAFEQTYGRLRNGFYGLRATVLTLGVPGVAG